MSDEGTAAEAPPRTEFTALEQEAARLLSRPVEDAAGWLEQVASDFEAQYRSKIDVWVGMLRFEYGCWCGPGSRCSEDVDAMDSCCHQHDLAYDSLGLTFDTMWSPAALVAARSADQALYDCVSASAKPEDDDVTRDYRALLLDVFKERLAIADWLRSTGL
jgi:hypothetical protein